MNRLTIQQLSTQESKQQLSRLEPGWKIVDEHHLKRGYNFKNFTDGLAFINHIGALAEPLNHHPDCLLTYNKVELEIYSHQLGGLCTADFELANQIDQLATVG